jgi:endogenous inhibitor of DNA gyrase (YacG/DUF329 family)
MSSTDQPERRRTIPCPLCGAAAQARFRPFCSQGCRDRDLLNWLGEAYRVPAGPAEIEEDQNAAGRLDSEA